MKKLSVLFLAAALFISQQAHARAVVGVTAPDFDVEDVNGNDVKLSSLNDKIVVLEWNNPECPFVKKHYQGHMQALQKEYTQKGVIWISINSGAEGKQGNYADNDAALADLKAKAWAGTHYIKDEGGKIGHAYGASTTPHMFIINKGEVVYQGAIDSIPSADEGDIAKADNYVAKALDELLAGKQVTTSVTQSYGCGVKYND